MTPAAPAVANAVADALGVRITELPFTPKRVLKAVKKLKESDSRRDAETQREKTD